MRRLLTLALGLGVLLPSLTAHAVSGRLIKVLPHFLDLKGRHALSPSLYERDAYQARLRQHPNLRSGMRFDVQWKAKDAGDAPLTLRLELRGAKPGNQPTQLLLESPVHQKGHFSTWTSVPLTGEAYAKFGDMVAWRATLWSGGQLLGEQQSFLWSDQTPPPRQSGRP